MYASLWDRYVLPRLGAIELRRLSPAVIESFQAELRREGVGNPTIIKTLTLLQGMLQRAVVWGRIPSNPVAPIKKPAQKRARWVKAIPPATVEAIRRSLLSRRRRRDATLVSVLAYAGLRPGEALALRWGDIGERTILVDRAVALGDVKGTKTGKSRSVRLLAPLAADLAEWRLACGRPDDDALVFPRKDGRVWTEQDWRNWRQRVFAPPCDRGRARRVPAIRPPPFVRLAALRRRAHGDRGRSSSGPLSDDGARDVRAGHRGAGGC
jgi:integrase